MSAFKAVSVFKDTGTLFTLQLAKLGMIDASYILALLSLVAREVLMVESEELRVLLRELT